MAILWMSLLLSYIFVSSKASYFNGPPGNDEFAISAVIAPSASCSAIGQIDTLLQCFKECLGAFRTFYMFSRDSVSLTCLCCKDPPSFSLPGNAWNTYIPPPCPQSYYEYAYGHLDICLRFVSDPQKYPMATSICQQDGGDLVRIDSQRKFEIFQQFVANTTNATIEVWVQGIRINYAWFYHDGTPMQFTCLVSESNHTSETRMRSMSEMNFGCFDITPWGLKMFVCEIYRVFNGF